jgi:integrase
MATKSIKPKSKSRYQRSKVPHLYCDQLTGIYYARARNAQGRDVWQSLSTQVFSVAKEKVLTKVAEIQAGAAVRLASASRQISTFGDAAQIYSGRVKAATNLKESSKRYRLETIAGLYRSWPELERAPFSGVTIDACLSWAAKYKEKVHGTRFNNTVDSLRHILDVAKEAGVIATNPATPIGKGKVTPKRLELPSREQFHAIVAAIASSGAWCARDCADMVQFLAYSGCRLTEATNIKWEHVDSKAGLIRIYGDPEAGGTKNQEARSIPFTQPLAELLERLRARDSEPHNPERRGQGFILYVEECYNPLAKACKKIGLKPISHHDLRHLFATRCIEAGVDIPTVSRWLGHRDGGALAMRVYGHLRDEHSQEMARRVTF